VQPKEIPLNSSREYGSDIRPPPKKENGPMVCQCRKFDCEPGKTLCAACEALLKQPTASPEQWRIIVNDVVGDPSTSGRPEAGALLMLRLMQTQTLLGSGLCSGQASA
jgi:hypothetical protein